MIRLIDNLSEAIQRAITANFSVIISVVECGNPIDFLMEKIPE